MKIKAHTHTRREAGKMQRQIKVGNKYCAYNQHGKLHSRELQEGSDRACHSSSLFLYTLEIVADSRVYIVTAGKFTIVMRASSYDQQKVACICLAHKSLCS